MIAKYSYIKHFIDKNFTKILGTHLAAEILISNNGWNALWNLWENVLIRLEISDVLFVFVLFTPWDLEMDYLQCSNWLLAEITYKYFAIRELYMH